MRVGNAAASVLTGSGGTVAGRDALVGVPLVDTHQAIPARAALAQVGAPAADLHRLAGLGQGDQAVLAAEGQVVPVVLDVGQAAVETCGEEEEVRVRKRETPLNDKTD